MRFLFGCRHKNTSFPVTLRSFGKRTGAAETYTVCFDCGKELPYSWDEMRIIKKTERKPERQDAVAVADAG